MRMETVLTPDDGDIRFSWLLGGAAGDIELPDIDVGQLSSMFVLNARVKQMENEAPQPLV